MGDVKLSPAQRSVLDLLARRDTGVDSHLSGPEVSRILRKRFDDWARGKLLALEKKGLVVRTGSTFSGGQCWNVTDAARSALNKGE